uniref:Ciliary opsin n=1 Tax=Platynereis dumerilii TaxID=6359 RepID=A0A288XNQ4_PLADU|nr:ciliary opsin [Platynereis dumerilii]
MDGENLTIPNPVTELMDTPINSTYFQNLNAETDGGNHYIYNAFTATDYNICAAYLFFIACLGVPLNVLVLVLFIKDRKLRSPNNFLYVSLALGDLLVAVFGTAFKFIITARKTLLREEDGFCKWYGFITYLGGLAALMTLSVIAFVRCLAVLRLGSFTGLTTRMGVAATAFIWIYSLAFTLAPLLGWNHYIPEGLATWCSIDWLSDETSNKSYVFAIFIFCFLVPVLIIVVSYGLIYDKVRKVAKTGGSVAKAEREVLKMTLLMVSLFMLAWSPYAVICMLASFGPKDLLHPVATVIPAMFAKSSTIYNPLIYVFMNKQFRRSLKVLLGMGVEDLNSESERATGGTATNQVAAT